MTNHRPRTMDEKQKRDEALNLADFKVDDIMRVPADELQAETAEDFGDPAFLAEEFDAIARPVMSRHGGKVDQREAASHCSPCPPSRPHSRRLRNLRPRRHGVFLGLRLRRRRHGSPCRCGTGPLRAQ
jgi:hypothetical protein